MSFLTAIGDTVRSIYCQLIGSNDSLARQFWGGDGFPPILSPNPLSDGIKSGYRALNRQFCQTAPPNFVSGRAPGQGNCNTLYNLRFDVQIYPDNCEPEVVRFGAQVQGPLGSVSFLNPNQNNPRCGGVLCFSDITIGDGFGVNRLIFTDSRRVAAGIRFTSISRVDGLPDNCAPPTPPPGSQLVLPIEAERDVVYTDGNDVNISVPIAFAIFSPTLNLNGQLTIPVTVNLGIEGTFNIDVFPQDDWRVQLNPKPDKRPIPPGDAPSDYTTTPDIPAPGTDPQPPEPSSLVPIIRAVFVAVTGVASTQTNLSTPGGIEVLAPDLGLIQFQIAVNGRIGLTEDIRIKNRRQFIPVPWDGGAIGWRATPRFGLQLNITPVYRLIDRIQREESFL